jgi:ketosteroid isomerase-like protein
MLGALLARRAVRQGLAAINRMDVDAVVAAFAEDAVLEFPGRSVLAGRQEGKEAIRRWFVRRFARLDRIHLTITHVSVSEPLALGGTNTVLVEWLLAESMADGRSHHVSGVTSLHLHDGQVVLARDYVFELDVFDAAWGTTAAAA